MARGRKVALILGAVAVAALLGSTWLGRESLAAWWRYQTVKKLLDPARRDEVFREILGWRRLAGGDASYFADLPNEEVIDRVIVCPQRRGLPMYVVVFRDATNAQRTPTFDGDERLLGNFSLVNHDGALIPARDGANFVPCYLSDINADGILEIVHVELWEVGPREPADTLSVFTLFAVTPKQEILLRVAYPPYNWTWEIRSSDEAPHAEIVIGPGDPAAGRVETVVARYRWDASRVDYVGPAGGLDGDFYRATATDNSRPEAWAELEPFALKLRWRPRAWPNDQ